MPARVLRTRTLYGGWTEILGVRLQLDDGCEVGREVEDHGNAAAVLPYDPVRRTAILVKLLRPPVLITEGRADLLECPAGMIEDEEPADTARREALEETGLRLRELEHAGRVWSSPGVSTERLDLYLASYSADDRVGRGGGAAGEHEDIQVTEIPLVALRRMIEAKQIEDLKTLALVALLLLSRPHLFDPDPSASG
ncbi:NUDIX hydrolase [Rhodoplanes sp. TEM]|uniref:GDP-mannose pyrophosphatase n=1 Tax=Rhodoplanes tepidamans TaxID=200616 RepID=A0ABT5J516_RHOTP|nr:MULTISPECIES: NUDIX hydrolase [Rhodoplanes]MDC7784724.1 NUDIX hydrolase [Rhodoplanes tepidamans]MDC7982191.1 NUDIX hydrolase [Rhodoplanes sp. TEM]MDQ0356195.1 nudix-type nucleoside diphosphatase (YffH/AdpP family) [Rhodoplanes tepidamans]